MSRPRNPVPAYKKHPTRDEARCWLAGRWVGLGPWQSEASLREYERLCAAVRESGPAAAARPGRAVSVGRVVTEFTRFALSHYRNPGGALTTEVKHYRAALAPLCELYGDSPAAEFGPLALQAVRRRMVDRGWCRGVVNRQVSRVRRVFKWAAAQELVPPSLPHGLACVQGLQRGRTDARESEPVRPVPPGVVAALLPALAPTLRAMVELQLHTGMRPGEVRLLRPRDVDRAGEAWAYRPPAHKTAWMERDRVIPLGPRARAVLAPWLERTDPDARCFTPANARDERYAALRAARKSKVPPSQRDRRKPAAELKRVAGGEFTDHGYAGAVRRAAARAGLPPFHPHQLRHTFATEVRRRYGLEAAQVLLGHSRADVTQLYAEKNMALALKVAGEMG